MKELVLATGNSGKIAELQALLSPLVCIPQNYFETVGVEETGLSFIENAIIKARHACTISGKPALADDSGLVVPALQGEPGIYSARFAGLHAGDRDNMHLLLSRMENLPDDLREAFFYCAIAVLLHENDPVPLIATGQWAGKITKKPMGDQGFGYDPVFFVSEHQCTAAALHPDIKNTISHRAQALQSLKPALLARLSYD